MESIETKRPEYLAALPLWLRCRAAVDGEDAVHDGGETYLPRLPSQSDGRYRSYLAGATYFNAVGRTVDAYTGLAFRKNPTFNLPSNFPVDDVDKAGTPLLTFCDAVLTDAIIVGRVGILVDYPAINQTMATVAEAEAVGARAFCKIYNAESIINWATGDVCGKTDLVRVVLAEADQANPKEKQYRELVIEDGRYKQKLWRDIDGAGYAIVDEYSPTLSGVAFQRIPFYIVGPNGVSPDIKKPPILDLATMNLSHYRTNALVEHGAVAIGNPTLVVTGHQQAVSNDGSAVDNEIIIGADRALIFEEPDARVFYLECEGKGYDVLFRLLEKKETQMAVLGARILSQDKNSSAESGYAQLVKRNGENSVLAALVKAVNDGLGQSLSMLSTWLGSAGDYSVQINTDFLPVGMDAQTLTALVAAWQQGAISRDTLFYNLRQGEVIADDVTAEEEADKAEISAGSMMPRPAGGIINAGQ